MVWAPRKNLKSSFTWLQPLEKAHSSSIAFCIVLFLGWFSSYDYFHYSLSLPLQYSVWKTLYPLPLSCSLPKSQICCNPLRKEEFSYLNILKNTSRIHIMKQFYQENMTNLKLYSPGPIWRYCYTEKLCNLLHNKAQICKWLTE